MTTAYRDPRPVAASLKQPDVDTASLNDVLADQGWGVQAVNWVFEAVTGESLVATIITPITGDWSKIRADGDAWRMVGNAMNDVSYNLTDAVGKVRDHWDGDAARAHERYVALGWKAALFAEMGVAQLIAKGFDTVASGAEALGKQAARLLDYLVNKLLEAAATVWVPLAGWVKAAEMVWNAYQIYRRVMDIIDTVKKLIADVKALFDAVGRVFSAIGKLKDADSLAEAMNATQEVAEAGRDVRNAVNDIRDDVTSIKDSATEIADRGQDIGSKVREIYTPPGDSTKPAAASAVAPGGAPVSLPPTLNGGPDTPATHTATAAGPPVSAPPTLGNGSGGPGGVPTGGSGGPGGVPTGGPGSPVGGPGGPGVSAPRPDTTHAAGAAPTAAPPSHHTPVGGAMPMGAPPMGGGGGDSTRSSGSRPGSSAGSAWPTTPAGSPSQTKPPAGGLPSPPASGLPTPPGHSNTGSGPGGPGPGGPGASGSRPGGAGLPTAPSSTGTHTPGSPGSHPTPGSGSGLPTPPSSSGSGLPTPPTSGTHPTPGGSGSGLPTPPSSSGTGLPTPPTSGTHPAPGGPGSGLPTPPSSSGTGLPTPPASGTHPAPGGSGSGLPTPPSHPTADSGTATAPAPSGTGSLPSPPGHPTPSSGGGLPSPPGPSSGGGLPSPPGHPSPSTDHSTPSGSSGAPSTPSGTTPHDGSPRPHDTTPNGSTDTKPHEAPTGTKPHDTTPHAPGTEPRHTDAKPHDAEAKPHDGDAKPHDGDAKSHDGDAKPHGADQDSDSKPDAKDHDTDASTTDGTNPQDTHPDPAPTDHDPDPKQSGDAPPAHGHDGSGNGNGDDTPRSPKGHDLTPAFDHAAMAASGDGYKHQLEQIYPTEAERERYVELSKKLSTELSPSEAQEVADTRNKITVGSGDLVTKVLHQNAVDGYLKTHDDPDSEAARRQGTVAGSIARAQDVHDINTPMGLRDGLALDDKGEGWTPIKDKAESAMQLRYHMTDAQAATANIPYGGPEKSDRDFSQPPTPGQEHREYQSPQEKAHYDASAKQMADAGGAAEPKRGRDPFTGTGSTGGGVPEWVARPADLPDRAEIWEVRNGEERLHAVYEKGLGWYQLQDKESAWSPTPVK